MPCNHAQEFLVLSEHLYVLWVQCKLNAEGRRRDNKPKVLKSRPLPGTGAAAMIELLSEPLYVLAQCRLLFRLRVGAETAAIVTKSAVTLALLLRGRMQPVIAISWAQV